MLKCIVCIEFCLKCLIYTTMQKGKKKKKMMEPRSHRTGTDYSGRVYESEFEIPAFVSAYLVDHL